MPLAPFAICYLLFAICYSRTSFGRVRARAARTLARTALFLREEIERLPLSNPSLKNSKPLRTNRFGDPGFTKGSQFTVHGSQFTVRR
jgi:hypothetical protein